MSYVEDIIVDKLCEIEENKNVNILMALESGSRAWGFESKDSDWDIRFIYCHSLNWYLDINISSKKDTINIIDGDLDFSGWELSKALRLFSKSNPPLLEWIRSPIFYIERSSYLEEITLKSFLREKIEFFSPRSCMYHYLHMAKGNFKEYLKRDENVKLKKYFYVLRPIFACEWIEKHNSPPPMPFEELLYDQEREKTFLNEIKEILSVKRSGLELGKGEPKKAINSFLEGKIEYFSNIIPEIPTEKLKFSENIDELNSMFRYYVNMVNQ